MLHVVVPLLFESILLQQIETEMRQIVVQVIGFCPVYYNLVENNLKFKFEIVWLTWSHKNETFRSQKSHYELFFLIQGRVGALHFKKENKSPYP